METMRIIIFIVAIAGFCVGGLLSFLDKVASAAATYAASVLCLIFVYLSKFKKFKGFGVEAELLEKKIEEADETLRRLRAVLGPMIEVLVTMIVRFGRFNSAFSRLEQYKIINEIEQELLQIGMEKKQLDKAKNTWHLFNMRCLARPILSHLNRIIDTNMRKGNMIADAKKQIDSIYKIDLIETIPSSIQELVNSLEFITQEEKEEVFSKFHENIEDLKYYASNRNFRRPEALDND